MIALDASALIEKLTFSPLGRSVEHLLVRAERVCAPDLLYVEVASSLWRLVRSGQLRSEDAGSAMAELHDLPLLALPHRELVSRAWQLRESVRIADAFYLACADASATSLLTTDRRLARGHHGVPVTLVT